MDESNKRGWGEPRDFGNKDYNYRYRRNGVEVEDRNTRSRYMMTLKDAQKHFKKNDKLKAPGAKFFDEGVVNSIKRIYKLYRPRPTTSKERESENKNREDNDSRYASYKKSTAYKKRKVNEDRAEQAKQIIEGVVHKTYRSFLAKIMGHKFDDRHQKGQSATPVDQTAKKKFGSARDLRPGEVYTIKQDKRRHKAPRRID